MINKKISIITVITDLYKNGRVESFEDCLRSVHEQTYKELEHIVIDNDSQDGTKALLDKYQQLGWIRYLSEPDEGIYDAMNKGVNLSSGEYVSFLNSDDRYHKKDGLEISMKYLLDSGATFSYAPIRVLIGKKKEFPDHPFSKPDISNVFFKMPISHQSMVVKKEDFIKLGYFEKKYRIASDYDMLVKLCLSKASSVHVPYPFVTYSAYGVSSLQVEKSLLEIQSVYEINHGRKELSEKEVDGIRRRVFHDSDFYITFPPDLAKELEDHFPYFDHTKFINANGTPPKISIITITEQGENLERTFNSIASQDIEPDRIEHIIIDNSSSADVKDQLDEYRKRSAYKVLCLNSKNVGRYVGLNKGVQIANHEYVHFLKSGETYLSQTSVKEILSKTEERDIVYGDIALYDGSNTTTIALPDNLEIKDFSSINPPIHAFFIRKNLFLKLGNLDESLETNSEEKFVMNALFNYHASYKHLNKKITNHYINRSALDNRVTNLSNQEMDKTLIELFCTEQQIITGESDENGSEMNTPILFLIYNRPTNTQKVFEKIRQVKPKYLYIVADGPREGKSDDVELTDSSRSIIDQVDWSCEVRTLSRNKNFGSSVSVSRGINWFFSHVEEGIILQDDCIPTDSFFNFSSQMLEKYREDKNVSHINGNVLVRSEMESSYYFSKFFNTRGWATWKRSWLNDHFRMKDLYETKVPGEFWFGDIKSKKYNRFDSWHYQWLFANLIGDKFSIMPAENMVTYINSSINENISSLDDDLRKKERNKLPAIWDHPKDEDLYDHEADYRSYLKLISEPGFKNVYKKSRHPANLIDGRLGYISNIEVRTLLFIRKLKSMFIPENSNRRSLYKGARNTIKSFVTK